jgi:predicted enzyme related to lactoylglutathione lyase
MSQTATATAAPATVPATAISWFEIPAADLERARRFYEAILEAPLKALCFEGEDIAVFPCQEGGVAGCLLETAHPSPHGTQVYLNVNGRLDRTLELVAANGGRVEEPKRELPNGIGWVARIADSEGNRVGLHAMQ